MGKGLLARDEVIEKNKQFALECRAELLKQGRFGKRGFSVDASALRQCIKAKWAQYKKQIIAERLAVPR